MDGQNIKPASAWISELGLTLMKDLCVGYFKEVHNSKVTVAESAEKEEKSAISSIYFLQVMQLKSIISKSIFTPGKM